MQRPFDPVFNSALAIGDVILICRMVHDKWRPDNLKMQFGQAGSYMVRALSAAGGNCALQRGVLIQALCLIFLYNPADAAAPAERATAPDADLVKAMKAPANCSIKIPRLRQATDYTCGVCALQAVLPIMEMMCAKTFSLKPSGLNNRDGTRYKEIADYATRRGYTVKR